MTDQTILNQRAQLIAPTIRDNRRLTFYAAVFNQRVRLTAWAPHFQKVMTFDEAIQPGTFRDTILEGGYNGEILGNVDHDEARTFAVKSAKSKRMMGETPTADLLLDEDDHGLFATCYLPRTELGELVYRKVDTGEYSGCSTCFIHRSLQPDSEFTKWDLSGNVPYCDVRSVILRDVCVTATPAYPGTDVSLRTAQPIKDFFRRLRIIKLKAHK